MSECAGLVCHFMRPQCKTMTEGLHVLALGLGLRVAGTVTVTGLFKQLRSDLGHSREAQEVAVVIRAV